ncbi:allophanate hydrolase subunit 1 [Micromonospora sp. NPDC049900]|uniref:allophanate hydrolase subunit 1 n=1 Tax=Micromonospora sp. NPDC049900 TaxID=3364275 RepID=UPI0037BDE5D7
MRIRPVGAHALLLDLTPPPTPRPDVDQTSTSDPGNGSPAGGGTVAGLVEAWRAELWRRREEGALVADEIVPAATTILVDGVPDLEATATRIADWTPTPTPTPAPDLGADRPTSLRRSWSCGYDKESYNGTNSQPQLHDRRDEPAVEHEAAVDVAASGESAGAGTGGRAGWGGVGGLVEVPVSFDGEDLPRVAELWRVDVSAVVRRLRETEFRVAFCGFAPGFGYLTGLPAELAVPRLATPRPRVPAGAVGLAGPYAGIYPTASPGGWLLVGRTGLTLFDVTADPPALLTPGTRVRLVSA